MKTSFKVSLGGAVAALGLSLMMLTGLIPVGTYAFPAFAGILLVMIVIEIGRGYALAVYAATALLSLFIVADKEAAVLYAVFLGYYPIVKSLIEKIHHRAAQYALKLALFNAAMIGAFYAATKLLSVPAESFTLFGIYMPLAFLAVGNAVFILYDICITRLVTLYLLKWREKLNKNTKL